MPHFCAYFYFCFDLAETTHENGRNYDDDIFLTCLPDGSWVGSQPICFPLCDPLAYPEHGLVSLIFDKNL